MKITKILLSLFIFSILLISCKKDELESPSQTIYQNPVSPDTSDDVNIQININLPEYNDLIVPGGWAYVTGGSQGLIVYRKNIDEFVALDRHCPYQPENLCRVIVDENDIVASDPCCHSSFLLLDGSITQGPSVNNLHRYNTIFNGTMLWIYN